MPGAGTSGDTYHERKLRAENERLRAALEKIARDGEEVGHPCGPKEYNHFGRIAIAALRNEQLTVADPATGSGSDSSVGRSR